MAKIAAKIMDKTTIEPVAARVQVLSVEGRFLHPHDSRAKVGAGILFFPSDGEVSLEAPRGFQQILVERGTEYKPERLRVNVPSWGAVTVEMVLERWDDLAQRGYHPGSAHIHYDQQETRPDELLRLDSRLEDLRLAAPSPKTNLMIREP